MIEINVNCLGVISTYVQNIPTIFVNNCVMRQILENYRYKIMVFLEKHTCWKLTIYTTVAYQFTSRLL